MIWDRAGRVQGVVRNTPAWQTGRMKNPSIDTLYREALVLADQARNWFDGAGQVARKGLAADAQAAFATESLRVTARLAAVMTWLIDGGKAVPPAWLGEPSPPLPAALAGTPGGQIALASRRLAVRVAAQETGMPR